MRRVVEIVAPPCNPVQIVRFVKRAQELGFTLEVIQELLALRESDTRTCGAPSSKRSTIARLLRRRGERGLDVVAKHAGVEERAVVDAAQLVHPEQRLGRLVAVPARVSTVQQIQIPGIHPDIERGLEVFQRPAAAIPEMARAREELEISGEAEAAMQGMMGYKGKW